MRLLVGWKRLLTPVTGTVVVGVVHPFGASGGRARGEKKWTLRFSLQPWRVDASSLETEELSVDRTCSHVELKALQARIHPYQVLRVRVRLAEGSPRRAELKAIIGEHSSDHELTEQAQLLQRPVTLRDPFFGQVTLDRRLDSWEASVEWNGKVVRASFNSENESDPVPALNVARKFWADEAGWDRRVREFAVQELLNLKNESWLSEGERELSSDEFKARMTLESIALYPDGSFEFWHHDGGLFWGHSILVSGSLDEGPTNADIPG